MAFYDDFYNKAKKYTPRNIYNANKDDPAAFLRRNTSRVISNVPNPIVSLGGQAADYTDAPSKAYHYLKNELGGSDAPSSDQGQGEGGNVLGLDLIAPGVDLGGSGGSGGGGGAGSVSARQALVAQRRQQAIDLANQMYNDEIADLDSGLGLVKDSVQQGKDFVGRQADNTMNALDQRQLVNQRQLRRDYQDSILEARRRARAIGGASSSGYLDITSRLDQNLSQNMQTLGSQVTDLKSQVLLTKDQAMFELENKLQSTIAQIESEKRSSRRKKDQMIADAELAAADEAIKIQEWAASRASSGKALSYSNQMKSAQGQLQQQYLTNLQAIANSGLDPQSQASLKKQVQQDFAIASAPYGGFNDSMTGYFFNEQDPYKNLQLYGDAVKMYEDDPQQSEYYRQLYGDTLKNILDPYGNL